MATRVGRAGLGILVAVVLAATASTAHATYLGENGKISFDRYAPDNTPTIHTVNPDGSNETPLIPGGRFSAWSPDGSRIAYTCAGGGNTCTAAADGTNIEVLDNGGLVPQYRPFWSPDSKRLIIDNRITFGHNPEEMYAELWRIDAADGSDHIRLAVNALSGSWSPNGRIAYSDFRETGTTTERWVSTLDATIPNSGARLTESLLDLTPDWSPDGTRLVFQSFRDGTGEIYVMNSDGSNETRLTTNSDHDASPVWSPDGTKILFVRESGGGVDLWTMNPDGTGQANLTNTPALAESEPAWQPVPQPGYVRPRGATPLRVSLVPSFEGCVEPNRTHGPPLAHPSCAPPQERAGFMTFGSAPAGSSPQAAGHVRLDALPGAPGSNDEADVRIAVSLTDVRRGTDLADGPGGLELQLPIRLTDKDSAGPFVPEQATMQDYTLAFAFPCVETADPSVGSTCAATTTADALVPAVVDEGVRAIWGLDQISVWDGGDDGFVESRDDNAVLAVQGVFVP